MIAAGTVVTFTVGPLGLVDDVADTRFRPEWVNIGEPGIYIGPHPTLSEPDWHVVQVGRWLCPCHASQFTVGGRS